MRDYDDGYARRIHAASTCPALMVALAMVDEGRATN
jgi:hypothetical protein